MSSFPEYSNLVDMLSRQAAARPDRQIFTFLGESGAVERAIDYLALHESATRVAAGLTARGLAGRNLMLLFAPGIEYIEAFFGCLYAGCVPVPAYPPMGARDIDRLKRVVVDCDAGAILSSAQLLPMIEMWVANAANGISLPCLATDTLSRETDASGFDVHQAGLDDLAFLQYTSGSTGHPKGVMVSHGNLLANFEQISRDFTSLDEAGTDALRGVFWLPPFHDMGLIGGILTPIFVGAAVDLMSPLTFLKNPFLWLKTISDNKGLISGGPNFSYQYCVRKITDEQLSQLDLSSWKVAFNGAEPIQMDSLRVFADRFAAAGFDAGAFLPCYGMAEATLFVTGSPTGRGALTVASETQALSEGRVQPTDAAVGTDGVVEMVSSGVQAQDCTVKIVDPKTCRECAEGEVGEIWVNSPAVAKGYWGKPAFSKSVFEAQIVDSDDARHYLRTGDLGTLMDGELFVTGRIKEVIIVAGRNHYPQDIERTLQSTDSAFRKGCGAAFAITQQGKEQLVIMQEIANGTPEDQLETLAATAARAITSRHGIAPQAIIMIKSGALPKTSSGKIQRVEARKVYELGNFAPLLAWHAVERSEPSTTSESVMEAAQRDANRFTDWQEVLAHEIQTWVGDRLNLEPHHIDLNVTFSELGVDSIEAIELVDRLQDRIGRTIPATELMRYPTVKALIEHFAAELKAKGIAAGEDHANLA